MSTDDVVGESTRHEDTFEIVTNLSSEISKSVLSGVDDAYNCQPSYEIQQENLVSNSLLNEQELERAELLVKSLDITRREAENHVRAILTDMDPSSSCIESEEPKVSVVTTSPSFTPASRPVSVISNSPKSLGKTSSKLEKLFIMFDLPTGESLISDFVCAISDHKTKNKFKSLLNQGKLYLFKNYFCFCSNYELTGEIRFKTSFSMILKAEKSGFFGIALKFYDTNRVEISDYEFTNFIRRDKALESILKLWEITRDMIMVGAMEMPVFDITRVTLDKCGWPFENIIVDCKDEDQLITKFATDGPMCLSITEKIVISAILADDDNSSSNDSDGKNDANPPILPVVVDMTANANVTNEATLNRIDNNLLHHQSVADDRSNNNSYTLAVECASSSFSTNGVTIATSKEASTINTNINKDNIVSSPSHIKNKKKKGSSSKKELEGLYKPVRDAEIGKAKIILEGIAFERKHSDDTAHLSPHTSPVAIPVTNVAIDLSPIQSSKSVLSKTPTTPTPAPMSSLSFFSGKAKLQKRSSISSPSSLVARSFSLNLNSPQFVFFVVASFLLFLLLIWTLVLAYRVGYFHEAFVFEDLSLVNFTTPGGAGSCRDVAHQLAIFSKELDSLQLRLSSLMKRLARNGILNETTLPKDQGT